MLIFFVLLEYLFVRVNVGIGETDLQTANFFCFLIVKSLAGVAVYADETENDGTKQKNKRTFSPNGDFFRRKMDMFSR